MKVIQIDANDILGFGQTLELEYKAVGINPISGKGFQVTLGKDQYDGLKAEVKENQPGCFQERGALFCRQAGYVELFIRHKHV